MPSWHRAPAAVHGDGDPCVHFLRQFVRYRHHATVGGELPLLHRNAVVAVKVTVDPWAICPLSEEIRSVPLRRCRASFASTLVISVVIASARVPRNEAVPGRRSSRGYGPRKDDPRYGCALRRRGIRPGSISMNTVIPRAVIPR